MQLPRPCGPVSRHVVHSLSRAAVAGPPIALADSPVLTDRDVQLALWSLYELSYRGFDGVDARREWDVDLIRLRLLIESRFESELRTATRERVRSAETRGGDIGELVLALVQDADGPRLSSYLRRGATLEQMRDYLRERSVQQLKESDPQAFLVPRLPGAAKVALAELQYDEFGAGRPVRLHQAMYAGALVAGRPRSRVWRLPRRRVGGLARVGERDVPVRPEPAARGGGGRALRCVRGLQLGPLSPRRGRARAARPLEGLGVLRRACRSRRRARADRGAGRLRVAGARLTRARWGTSSSASCAPLHLDALSGAELLSDGTFCPTWSSARPPGRGRLMSTRRARAALSAGTAAGARGGHGRGRAGCHTSGQSTGRRAGACDKSSRKPWCHGTHKSIRHDLR